MSLRKKCFQSVLALLVPAALVPAWADAGYPSKPVRIIVPYSAGGSSDVMARAIGDELGQKLGQPVIVENRAGAGSLLGTQYVSTAAADGYTLLLADVPYAIVPALYQARAKYEPLTSFAPVALLGVAPMYLFTNPNNSLQSVPAIVQAGKQAPDSVSIGSGGNGSLTHLMAELFMANAQVRLTHVPYKGAAASVTDLAAGQLGLSFTTMASATALMQAGKIKPLAVTSPERAQESPNVPTFAELGMPGMNVQSWWGLMAPAGTPETVTYQLSAAMQEVLQRPAVRQRMQAAGVSAAPDTSAKALREMVRADTQRWSDVVQRAGIKID